MAPAAKQTPDGPPKLPREIVGLVEAAPERAKGVERHRYDRIDAVERVARSDSQELAERLGQLPAAVVLECVHDFPERPVVSAGASGQ